MKWDFSNFCSCSDVWKENKKAKLSGIDKSCFTVYSFKYFFEVLHRLTVAQKCAIQRFGFACLLGLAKTHIPSSFILWLACCVDYHFSQIIVDDKIINISKDSFHFVLGLPNSGSEVVEDSEGGADFIMSLFHLSEVPHITFFGDMLKSTKPLSDEQVFVCFMQIAISCFLCPCANDRLDTKYIKQLGDFDRASSFDICQLVYNHFILGVEKLLRFIEVKERKPKSFEFCSFALAVQYLDCLDFGAHIVGSGVPRAVSWNGDMIVEYSELDRRSKRCFGRRRLRSDLPSVYVNRMFKSNMDGMNCGTSCEPMSEQVKQSFHDKFGMILDGKIIDGIFETVQSLASSQFGNKNMLEILSHNVLQFLSNAHPCYKSNSTISPAIGCLDTPVALTSNHVVQNFNLTAPQIHPLRKVMSRLSLHLPENNVPGPCQSDLISPIGRLNLSPSRGGMDTMKVPATTSMQNILPKASDGSKQAPIPVGDTTPEAILKADASPGVTITGTSSFKDKQKELAAKGDDVYNRTVHPRSSHVSKSMKIGVGSLHVVEEGVEVVDVDKFVQKQPAIVNGFVTLQPKNNLVFPLADNPRFPISDDDIMSLCAIVELAYTDRIQKNYALKYHGVHCSFISLGHTLMRDGH